MIPCNYGLRTHRLRWSSWKQKRACGSQGAKGHHFSGVLSIPRYTRPDYLITWYARKQSVVVTERGYRLPGTRFQASHVTKSKQVFLVARGSGGTYYRLCGMKASFRDTSLNSMVSAIQLHAHLSCIPTYADALPRGRPAFTFFPLRTTNTLQGCKDPAWKAVGMKRMHEYTAVVAWRGTTWYDDDGIERYVYIPVFYNTAYLM